MSLAVKTVHCQRSSLPSPGVLFYRPVGCPVNGHCQVGVTFIRSNQ